MKTLNLLSLFGILMLAFFSYYTYNIFSIEKAPIAEEKVLIDSQSESLYIKVSDKIIEYKKKGIDLECGDIQTDGDFFYVICNK